MTGRHHRPTSAERSLIRHWAARDAGFARVEINPSTKRSLVTGQIAMNIALISNDPHFGDTDLDNNAFTWTDFCRGFPMTEDGRAIIDFYVYNVGKSPELQTNVTAYWENWELVRIDGVPSTVWRKQR